MTHEQKINLTLYWIASTVSFIYLVLPQKAAISVPIFIILQFVMLFFIVPKRKPLLLFIPMFLISLNSFISTGTLWQTFNFITIFLLYNAMTLMLIGKFPRSTEFISRTISNTLNPLYFFSKPFELLSSSSAKHTRILYKVATSILISIPILILLLMMLSSADAVFANMIENFWRFLADLITLPSFFKLIFGVAVGLYLSGLLYMTMEPDKIKFIDYKPIKYSWDLLITNITSTLVLIIYTFFVLIQITYLFTGIGTLPAGLTYAEYARRGFFQLLILSIINIVMIFAIINLTRNATGKWAKYKTVILAYSCFVTAVLLASSFYRMWLYIDFYGMTRLRFLVISFLCFEILGLIATVRYVMRPTFNIVGVYVCIMLAFYTFVNLAPMDAIIAKNQVDRYIADESGDIYYVTTLSNDVVPQLSRLLEYENSFEDNPWSARDEDTAWLVRDFITRANNNKLPPLWQRWHLYDILSSNID